MALLIYAPRFNSRIDYAFRHIFENILGVSIAFTKNKEEFLQFEDAKIVYSIEDETRGLNFKAHPFIFEQNIKAQNLAFADWEELKIPFPVNHSVFTFDVFAATFYLLSRYEEYVIKERDEQNRFEGKSSLAFQSGFLTRPMIDEWTYMIADQIKKEFPDFRISPRKFHFQPTLNIDQPYFYLTDAYFKQKVKKIKHQLKTDPFDIYEQVGIWDHQFGLNTLYFFLVGNQHENDVAPSSENELFKELIKKVAEQHPVGIHLSYFSNSNPSEMRKERNLLIKMSQRKISLSRQNYLMLSFPKTYRDLIFSGIKEDYTLAYADLPGFRASTCTPFHWYDLEKESITDLLIHPIAFMDQTLKKYMRLDPDEAIQLVSTLIENVKKVNGTFISIWSNDSVSDFGIWKEWKTVYLEMLKKGSAL
ncbi:MAG: polysaccharide deacetylase family protein [Pelobium sp.]